MPRIENTENEQKRRKKNTKLQKNEQNHQKITENNEYGRNNTLFVVCLYV